MDKNSDEKFIIMQTSIKSNKQEMIANKQHSDDKMTRLKEDFKTMLSAITYQINTFKSLPSHRDPPKPQ